MIRCNTWSISHCYNQHSNIVLSFALVISGNNILDKHCSIQWLHNSQLPLATVNMWALMVMCVPLLFAFSGWLFPTNLLESILSAQTAFVALFLFLLLMLREKRRGGGGCGWGQAVYTVVVCMWCSLCIKYKYVLVRVVVFELELNIIYCTCVCIWLEYSLVILRITVPWDVCALPFVCLCSS